jgi:hypothetical protein
MKRTGGRKRCQKVVGEAYCSLWWGEVMVQGSAPLSSRPPTELDSSAGYPQDRRLVGDSL